MNVRIQSPQAKVTYVSVGFVIVLAAALIAAVPAGAVTGIATYMAFLIAWIAVGTRTFRSDGEAVQPPRAWWRMTHKPTAGFVIAALLVIHALTSITQFGQENSTLVGYSIIFDVLIAGCYVRSSMKLRTMESTQKAATHQR